MGHLPTRSVVVQNCCRVTKAGRGNSRRSSPALPQNAVCLGPDSVEEACLLGDIFASVRSTNDPALCGAIGRLRLVTGSSEHVLGTRSGQAGKGKPTHSLPKVPGVYPGRDARCCGYFLLKYHCCHRTSFAGFWLLVLRTQPDKHSKFYGHRAPLSL